MPANTNEISIRFKQLLESYLDNQNNESAIKMLLVKASFSELKDLQATIQEVAGSVKFEMEKTSFVRKHLLSKKFKELSSSMDRLQAIELLYEQILDNKIQDWINLISRLEAFTIQDPLAIDSQNEFKRYFERVLKKEGVSPEQREEYLKLNREAIIKGFFKSLKARISVSHPNPLNTEHLKELELLVNQWNAKFEKKQPVHTHGQKKPVHETKDTSKVQQNKRDSINSLEAYNLLNSPRGTIKEAALSIRKNIEESLTPHEQLIFFYDLIKLLVSQPMDNVKISQKQKMMDALIALHVIRKEVPAYTPEDSTSRKYYKKLEAILKVMLE